MFNRFSFSFNFEIIKKMEALSFADSASENAGVCVSNHHSALWVIMRVESFVQGNTVKSIISSSFTKICFPSVEKYQRGLAWSDCCRRDEVRVGRRRSEPRHERLTPRRPSVPRAVSWLPGQILANPLERDEEDTSSERRCGQTWGVLSPTVCFLCVEGTRTCYVLDAEESDW